MKMAKAGAKVLGASEDPENGNGNGHNGNVAPEETLRVRYNGRSDQRVLTRNGLTGDFSLADWSVVWTPGSDVPLDVFLELAGTRERASEVLRAHKHEFDLVGPGAEEFWAEMDDDGAEEFSVEGPVQ